ncbi:MAG: lytic transglycosylase domain-containing protein, partial [Gammaproteobacteria bacterium]
GALGLMQVMPATGKLTAKKMGLKNFKVDHLLEAEKNVTIGSAYLRQMLDQFGGNMILATAAYNAGPGRVQAWLPKSGCMDPDIWVEKIPFTETRKYVRRVMFYSSIYDWRLSQTVLPLSQRMTAVSPATRTMLAQLGCGAEQVSFN